MGKYTVISYDNGCFGEGGAPISRGEYDLAAEAIGRASELVDMALSEHFANASGVADLMTYFSLYGSEVPYIHGEPTVDLAGACVAIPCGSSRPVAASQQRRLWRALEDAPTKAFMS